MCREVIDINCMKGATQEIPQGYILPNGSIVLYVSMSRQQTLKDMESAIAMYPNLRVLFDLRGN